MTNNVYLWVNFEFGIIYNKFLYMEEHKCPLAESMSNVVNKFKIYVQDGRALYSEDQVVQN